MSRVRFVHPRIWTGAATGVTDALLVEDDRVIAVGHEARAAGADRTVDLPGALVMPGLHDAHIHTAWTARDLASVDLSAASTLGEALDLIRAHAATLPAGRSIGSGRWNSNRWTPAVQPDRHSLDTVCPDRIVALDSADGHTVWANSLALQAAGITRNTPDPVGGQLLRDVSGEPTGILRESAQHLLDALPEDEQPLRPLLERCQELLLSVGLTSVTDIDGEDAHAAYAAMHAEGTLRLRVTKCIRDGDLELAIAEGRRAGSGDGRFRVGPVKFFSDGALGSHTAYLTEPYLSDPTGPEGRGIAAMPYPLFLHRVRMAVEAGLDVATHAIGDAANRLVLDAYGVMREEGHTGILRIEHAQHVLPVDIPRFRTLDVIASMQPAHCTADIDLVEKMIGPRRVATHAWRTMLGAAVRLALGSDAPVEEPNPFHALHAAVTRQRANGSPLGGWHPEERITLDQAVHAHTVGAHEAAGRTDVGRLIPGQLADFVSLDRDPWSLEHSDPGGIRDTRVLATWVGGEPAFEA